METKKLNSYEQTSYWWINRLKSKINQLYLVKKREGNLDDNSELEFLSIFESFGEKDWRNIYLELRKYIKIDVSEFASSDYFSIWMHFIKILKKVNISSLIMNCQVY